MSRTTEPGRVRAPKAARPTAAVFPATSSEAEEPPCTDVSQLPDDLRQLATDMLVQGATYEDVFEAVNERGKDKITLPAVRNYFRSDLKIQADRIKHRLQVVRILKAALGDDADSGQKDLAEAALVVGLMGLERKNAQFDMQDAVREHGHRETFRLKTRKATLDEQVVETRLQTEQAKLQLIQHKVEELERALNKANKGQGLGPEAWQKIREIYGLISEPTVQAQS